MDWLLFLTGALAGWSLTILVWICIRAVYYAVLKRKRVPRKKWPIEEFRRRRADDFRLFENHCEPAALLENPVKRARLCGKTDSEAAIQETFHTILKMSFRELRSSLQSDDYNAYTVMCAFGWRAMKINGKLNCITEVMKEAFDEAAALDEQFSGKSKPPLFGMPFSVKSNFYVNGYDATVGLAKLLDKREHDTCGMVRFLKDQGAIPFCLTNVPQGLLSYITSNPLYGTTKNPWDFTRTPGGSSGGEAAMVAAGGASFGIGNDLVGSLRIPAAFCGLVSLKPGQNRLDEVSMNPGLPGRGRLGLSSGFYTKNVTDQEFLLRLIVGNPEFRKFRPQSSPAQLAPIVEESDRSTVCIGWFVNDGFTTVSESNKRAVIEMRDRLKGEGYTLKEFRLQDVAEEFPPEAIADMLFRNAMPDNGAYLCDMYSYEDVDKYMAKFITLIKWRQSTVVSWLLRNIGVPIARWKVSRAVACLGNAYNSDFEALRQNQENTDTFRMKWIQYWRDLGIDALICPSFITPAQPFQYPAWLTTGCFITGLFNMLDVPAGIVPVEEVGRIENNDFKDNGDFLLHKQRKALENTAGLPNALQVVALPNEEETCLKVMKVVERLSDGVTNLRWIEERDTEPVIDRHDPDPELWEATRYFERVPRQL